MIKILRDNKVLFFCLLVYLVGQIMFWHVQGSFQAFLILLQELAYLVAVIYGCCFLKKTRLRNNIFWANLFRLFFIVNVLLFLYWWYVVHLNPEINWKLQGNDYEVDPWYYVIYIPIINFTIAFLFLIVAYLIKWNDEKRKES